MSHLVSCVNLSMLPLCLRTTWPDDSLLSPAHLVMLLLQCQLFCLQLWNPGLFTGRATLCQTCCFGLSLHHMLYLTLNDGL